RPVERLPRRLTSQRPSRACAGAAARTRRAGAKASAASSRAAQPRASGFHDNARARPRCACARSRRSENAVARPRVSLEEGDHLRVDEGDRWPARPADSATNCLTDGGMVIDKPAIEEPLTEQLRGDELLEIPIRRGDEA